MLSDKPQSLVSWLNSRSSLTTIKPLMALALPCVLGLGALGTSGCQAGADAHEEAPAEAVPEGMLADVNLSLRFPQSADDATAAEQSLFGLFALAPADIELTAVDRVLIDVFISDGEPGNDVTFMVGFDLEKTTGGDWFGRIPFLPADTQLRFVGHAFNEDGSEIFTGETLATLTVNGQDVNIPLAPAQDGETFDMPRMARIAYPEEVVAGQEVQMIFTLEGNSGETIAYDIRDASGELASEFLPNAGTVTLTGAIADFITLYAVPEVDTTTEFAYTVTIHSADALSSVAIATEIETTAVPRAEAEDGVSDTDPTILFNPVVLELTANGTAIPGTVELFADVSDDTPDDLTFQWSFTPNASTPDASFADATVNPASFEGYTIDHQGTIQLAVTDADGGTTTLFYELVREQFDDVFDPGAVNGLKKIVGGESHTCVLTGDSKVRCWGLGESGQLGHNSQADIGDDEAPGVAGDVPLLESESVIQIAAGDDHTCALLDFGFIRCWGKNNAGQLGYNRTDNLGDGEPVTSFGYVSVGGTVTKIAAGGDHTCAVLDGGFVRCWGDNQFGQLGHDGTEDIGDDEAVFKEGNIDLGDGVVVRDVAAGLDHTCAILSDDSLRCWGRNSNGQLGYGDNQNRGDNEPLVGLPAVNLPGPVRKVALGHGHTCALLKNGEMHCWGRGLFGELGNGFRSSSNPNYGDTSAEVIGTQATLVDVGAEVTDIAANGAHTCALLSDSQLKCWGEGDNGRLGYGNTNSLGTPLDIGVDLDGVSAYQITTGRSHTCALRSNGTARCWGINSHGELGLGNEVERRSPAASEDIQIFAP